MSNNDRKPSPSSNCLSSKQNLNHSCKIKEQYKDMRENSSVLLGHDACSHIKDKKDILKNIDDLQFDNSSVSILADIFHRSNDVILL